MQRDVEVRSCREARWFVAGEVPSDVQPSGRPRRRVDVYHLPSLRPWDALKRRGGSVLERKVRAGRVELVTVGGVEGFAETWVKQRRPPADEDGGWIAVSKHTWSHGGVEVAQVAVDGLAAWTVCVDLGSRSTPAGRDELQRWRELLEQRGEPGSYPAWLVEHISVTP